MDRWITDDNVVLRTHSSRLRTDLTAIVERSRDLCWWSRRLLAPHPFRIRPIAGAANQDSDIGLVVDSLRQASLCSDCIVTKTGIPVERTHVLLGVIENTLRITDGMALCDACQLMRWVYRLT